MVRAEAPEMCGMAWEGYATMAFAPIDETINIDQLTRDPYSIYRRLRAEAPVVTVKSIGRTLLTKAADTRAVKDNAALFSNNDPNTPMQRAFQAHTLMRKDGEEHMRERMAMTPTFSPRNSAWALDAKGRSTSSVTGRASMSARMAISGRSLAPRR